MFLNKNILTIFRFCLLKFTSYTVFMFFIKNKNRKTVLFKELATYAHRVGVVTQVLVGLPGQQSY